jgi:hypothetical protein
MATSYHVSRRINAPADRIWEIDDSPPPVIREIAPGIVAGRGEGRPSKRLRRELERMRRTGRG